MKITSAAGFLRRWALVVTIWCALGVALACPPRPPVDGGVTTTVSSWTYVARIVVTTIAWAAPAVRAITDAILPEPARTIVSRALDAVGDWSGQLNVALDAYENRGGDRCAAYAAVGGLRAALVSLGEVLVDNGIAMGRVLERVSESSAAIADLLVPICQNDAGFYSAGAADALRLREARWRALQTARPMRHDLDSIAPPPGFDAGVR